MKTENLKATYALVSTLVIKIKKPTASLSVFVIYQTTLSAQLELAKA